MAGLFLAKIWAKFSQFGKKLTKFGVSSAIKVVQHFPKKSSSSQFVPEDINHSF
jgi:hypothetical protein